MARPPALILKAIRVRAGLSGEQCAEHVAKVLKRKNRKGGQAKGHATTWYRYESPAERDMGDRKIPYKLIQAVAPLLVGRGDPPVKIEELIAISEANTIDTLRRVPLTGGHAKVSVYETAPVFPKSTDDVKTLTVRYRAERGVFMTEPTLHNRSFGVGPIVEAPEYKAEQACVLVADDHADPTYPQGTVLHIIHMSAYTPAQLKHKRVVLSIKKAGLAEVAIGMIHEVVGNTYVIKSLDGEELDGDILGVVFRSLRRE